MERIEVAKIKPGQSVTLEFGDKEPILTKLEGARHFKLEDWYEEEREIYLVDDVIQEDEPLRYSLAPLEGDPEGVLRKEQGKFGKNRTILTFLGRVVDSIEMAEEEEDAI